MTYAYFLEQEEADVEDLVDRSLYVHMVNEEFKGELASPVETATLMTGPTPSKP